LVQLLQARLCRSAEGDRSGVAKRYISALAVGTGLFAISLFAVRRPLVSLVYLRGNFSSSALEEVLAILPAWLCYFVVLCLNTIISQYMFHAGKGYRYTRNMLAGYAGTNILRFAIGTSVVSNPAGAPWIIWCGVISEGGAFFANVLTCATRTQWSPAPVEVAYEEV
jgi:peptidoglycan biosynthesis protein MviN/MurJ (putative lipid II flippase)